MPRNLQDVLHELRKVHGKNAIKTGNELKRVKVKATGLPMLDLQLGGGFRMRAINLIAGKYQSGKTSVAMQFCGECQKDGFFVIWADLEKQFDIERAVNVFHMNPDLLWILESDKDSDLLAENLQRRISDIIRAFNKLEDSRLIIVLDSLAANVSEKDTEEDNVTKIMGGNARINNQSIKIWNSLLSHDQCFIMINEFREKIGEYGNPDYMPGGLAQYYFASTIIHTRQAPVKEVVLDENKTPIAERFNWTVKKSRNAPPRETGGIIFNYLNGFDITESLVQYCIDQEIITKKGSHFQIPGVEKSVQGKENLVAYLNEDRGAYQDLWDKFYSEMPREQYIFIEEEDEKAT